MRRFSIAAVVALTLLLALNAFAVTPGPTITTTAPIFLAGTTTNTYLNSITVTVNPGTASTCYYLTGTSTVPPASPTNLTGTACATPIVFTATTPAALTTFEVKAINYDAFGKASAVVSKSFIVATQLSTPTFALVSGTTNDYKITAAASDWVPCSSTVTASCATVYYNIDGSAAPTTKSLKYNPNPTTGNGYVTWNTGETIQAIAVETGYETSAVGTQGGGSAVAGAFITSGSSAQFNTFALAAAGPLGNGVGGACGPFHWTIKSNNSGTGVVDDGITIPGSTSGVAVVDARSGSTPTDIGSPVWVVWNTANGQPACNAADVAAVTNGCTVVNPPTKLCMYAAVDSAVGVRNFMNSNLSIPASFVSFISPAGTAGANVMDPFWDKTNSATKDLALPSVVLNALQGQSFTAGNTDIRPEDAKFATTRALGTVNTTLTGLGYGPGPIGITIFSSQTTTSTNIINVADFALTGSDPITGAKQNPYVTLTIGAAPVVVFVNTANTTAGHFGDPTFGGSISRFALGQVLNGNFTHTSSVTGKACPTGDACGIQTFTREPTSGTYNTMEWSVVASKEIASSQEVGVSSTSGFIGNTYVPACTSTTTPACTPTVPAHWLSNSSTNPLYLFAANGSSRQRAIGTGEHITAAAGTSDGFGYSFWGYGNYSSSRIGGGLVSGGGNNSTVVHARYLAVDAIDPLIPAYTGGNFYYCDAFNGSRIAGVWTCPNTVSFDNIKNGTYPIWSIYRIVTNAANQATAQALINAAVANAATVQDFVPANQLNVFHTHYTQAGVKGVNGVLSIAGGVATAVTPDQAIDSGGDMGGAVFTGQADADHYNDFGTEILSIKQ